jgi:hypothetical protein
MPATFIVDSLTGRGTDDQRAQAVKGDVEEPGFAGAKTAKQIAYFFQQMDLMDVPCYVVLVRHEKTSMESSGPMTHVQKTRTPGGADPDFRGSFDIRVKRIGGQRLTRYAYNNVAFRIVKNSFAPGDRSIVVRFGWDFSTTDEDIQQAPRWEWALGEVDFLRDYGDKPKEPTGIKDVCHITSKSNPASHGHLYSCKQLGLKEVSPEDMSLAIHQDEKVFRGIQNFLEIMRWDRFDPHRELIAAERKVRAK